jgi:hypothetical protein
MAARSNSVIRGKGPIETEAHTLRQYCFSLDVVSTKQVDGDECVNDRCATGVQQRVPSECRRSVVVDYAICWGREPPWSSKLARQVYRCEAGTDINIGVVRCDQPRSA